MELGLGVLHISPDVFWRMSLAEWRAVRDGALGSRGLGLGNQPVFGEELSNLMKTYPDRKNNRW